MLPRHWLQNYYRRKRKRPDGVKLPKTDNDAKLAATTRGLGRGLSTLLGDSGIAAVQPAAPHDREYQQIPVDGLMLVRGNRVASLTASNLMNWPVRFAKKVLFSQSYCGPHQISEAGFNLLLVNGAGVQRKLRSFMIYHPWFVT